MARLAFTILGCGASPGVPRIDGDWGACDPLESRNRRSRCAALIEHFGEGAQPTRVLIDVGPDIRQQLLAAKAASLDAVILTHTHADHLHGIDDLRAYWLASRKLLDIYADGMASERLLQGFGYCFAAPVGSSYPPILRLLPARWGEPIRVDGPGGVIEIVPFRQIHGDIESLGLRVGRIAYSCDIGDVPPESLRQLENLDVWIVDALRYKPHPSHFSLSDALRWIERIGPKRAILTHMHGDLDYRTVQESLPAGIEAAFDGMRIESEI